jgi:hypothetical protein
MNKEGYELMGLGNSACVVEGKPNDNSRETDALDEKVLLKQTCR